MKNRLFGQDEKLAVGYNDIIGLVLIINRNTRKKGYESEIVVFSMNLAKKYWMQISHLQSSSSGYRIYEHLVFVKLEHLNIIEKRA